MANWLLISALAVAAALGCVYLGAKTADCWGHGALVKNAWGGLDCVPVAAEKH